MGKYIGVMQHFATFYNFKPLVEIERNGSLSLMDDADRERLLPESKNLNINIYYNVYDTAQATCLIMIGFLSLNLCRMICRPTLHRTADEMLRVIRFHFKQP